MILNVKHVGYDERTVAHSKNNGNGSGCQGSCGGGCGNTVGGGGPCGASK